MKKSKLVLGFIFSLALIVSLIACNASTSKAYAYVTYDINPSVALVVNQQEKVVSAEALNEDGEVLLADITLVGLTLEAATELIIQTSIELGFIDVTDENITVEMQVEGNEEALRTRIKAHVMAHINNAFEKRALMGKASEKSFGAEIQLEAQALGVSAQMVVLVHHAMRLNDELTLEEALEMSLDELRTMIIELSMESRQVAAQIRTDFLDAKEALKAEYQPLIEALEAEIALKLENEEDTTELEAELALLIAEFRAEFSVIRETFLEASATLRAQLRIEARERKAANADAVNQFFNEIETRKEALKDAINQFQGRG